jgi:hypothetical protein
MKTIIRIQLLVLLLLCCSALCYGQLPDEFSNLGYYEQLRVNSDGEDMLIIKRANIGERAITSSVDSTSVNFDQVNKLEYKVGDKSMSGGITGTLVGCGVGIIIALSTSKTEEKDHFWGTEKTTTIQTWPIYLFGVAGGFFGLAQGKNSVIYETLHDGTVNSMHNPPELKLTFLPSHFLLERAAYLSLSYQF